VRSGSVIIRPPSANERWSLRPHYRSGQ
jgi:hypothetical protein